MPRFLVVLACILALSYSAAFVFPPHALAQGADTKPASLIQRVFGWLTERFGKERTTQVASPAAAVEDWRPFSPSNDATEAAEEAKPTAVAFNESPPPVVNQYITQPIVERIIERQAQGTVLGAHDGLVTQAELSAALTVLETNFNRALYGPSYPVPSTNPADGGILATIGMVGRIENLSDTKLTTPAITGGTITDASVAATMLSASGGATLSNGLTVLSGGANITGALTVDNVTVAAGGSINVGDKIISEGEIGVGTTTPGAKLAVQGTDANQTAFLLYGTSTQSNPLIDIYDNPASGLNLLRLSAAGSLGIGTTSPFAKLSVAGDIFANGGITGSNITATGTLSVSGAASLSDALTVSGSTSLEGPLTVNGLTALANASSTLLSAGRAYFGEMATSTFAADGTLTLAQALGVGSGGTGITDTPSYGQLLLGNAGGTYTLTATSSLGLLTEIGPQGQFQAGPTVTLATSTASFNGLTTAVTVTGSGNTLTFTPSLSGTLDNAGLTNSTVSYGGVALSLGGSDATPAFDLADATNLPIVGGTTGTLTVARGGTGATTLSGLLQGNGSGAITGVTGTAGQFPYYDGTNTLSATSSIFLATSGNVGIGISSPLRPLHVQSGSAGVSPHASASGVFERSSINYLNILSPSEHARGILFGDEGHVANGGIIFNSPSAQDGLQFRTGGNSTRMTVTDNGNVGIGTTTPSRLLELSHAGNVPGLRITRNDSAVGNTGMEFANSSGVRWAFSVEHDNFRIKDSYSGGNTFLTIARSSGSVGIGTTNPLSRLHVSRDWEADGDILARIVSGNNVEGGGNVTGLLISPVTGGGGHGGTIVTALDVNINKEADIIALFRRSSNEVMRIQGDGNVGIGTTDPGSFKLLVDGSAAKPGGGSWSDSSDLRLKTDVLTISGDDALAKLMELNPVNFAWLHPDEHGGFVASGGFLAQELQDVFPEFVGTTTCAGADCDLVGGEGAEVYTLSLPFKFFAHLVAAVQELHAKLTNLANTVAGFAERLVTAEIVADLTQTEKLCIGETCITEAELKELLEGRNEPDPGDSASSSSGSGESIAPTIQVHGSNPAKIEVGSAYSDLGARAKNADGKELSIKVFVDGKLVDYIEIDTSKAGEYEITYRADDGNGNSAEARRTVVVFGEDVSTEIADAEIDPSADVDDADLMTGTSSNAVEDQGNLDSESANLDSGTSTASEMEGNTETQED